MAKEFNLMNMHFTKTDLELLIFFSLLTFKFAVLIFIYR